MRLEVLSTLFVISASLLSLSGQVSAKEAYVPPPKLAAEVKSNADVSVAGVELAIRCEQKKSEVCALLVTKLTKLTEKRPMSNHRVEVANKSETEVLTGHYTGGAEVGEFQKMTVELRKSKKMDKANVASFKTGNGVALGQSVEDVKAKLGEPTTEKAGKKLTTLTYKNEDVCGGQTYSAKYEFKAGKLEKFAFGCELSTKF